MKKALFAILCFLGLAVGVFFFYSGAIFQRGNPLPYMSKMLTLSDGEQFAKVFADTDIYLSRKSGYDDLIKHIENAYNVSFAERMGSAYKLIQMYFQYAEKNTISGFTLITMTMR